MKIPDQLPFLQAICWQVADVRQLAPIDMLKRYERGWAYLGVLGDIGLEEAAFLRELVDEYGSWLAGRL